MSQQFTAKNYALGIICMLIASVFLAFMGAFAKMATTRLSVEVVAFYQFLIGLIITLPVVFRKKLKLVKTKHPYLHLTRVISGFFFFYLLYLSLASILFVDAIVLSNTAPLFVPIVMWIWCQEKLHWGLGLSLLIGFVGILLILHPGGEDFLKTGSLLALGSGVSGGVGLVAIRKLMLSDKAETISFYYFLFSTIILIPIISLFYQWQLPRGHEWWPVIGMGLFLPCMQYFQAKATYFAPATRVGFFFYAAIIFSGLLGWWFWDEIPSLLSVIGTILVVVGAVISIIVRSREIPNS